MRNVSLIFVLLFTITSASFSQKSNQQKSEELQFLKGQNIFNLRFDFEGMLVGNLKEGDYVEKKREEKNSRSQGTGDYWAQNWEDNKSEYFPERFEKFFNKYLQKKNINAEIGANAPYTLIVKTIKLETWVYTSYSTNTGRYSSQMALADLDFYFVKSDNPEVVLWKYRLEKIPGSDPNFMGLGFGAEDARMQNCYAEAGKMLAKYILKHAFAK